jgi:pyruvate-ferredoxin/flavodoxin oxidoreductase
MKEITIIDGNEAAALIAYKLSEVIAIYPITPSSTMGELADQWMSQNHKNIFNITPSVIEMQSEGGAAGAVHGALAAGALSTTFTASQGLLLMIPNMYKIAGEMIPTVFHIAARTLATSGLSIFGDHQDVMAARQTGFAFIASNSVQEAHDLALISHIATLRSRIPFLHFFDGFRTSHEVQKVEIISDEIIKKMVNMEDIIKHRRMSLTPDRPQMSGTAMNPDVCFQARERINPFYEELPKVVLDVMTEFKKHTGRSYLPYDYYGSPDATEVIVMMGSGAETVEETIDYLNKHENRKLGLIKVRMYRPFSIDYLFSVLPKSVKTLCVLDRTKEPGAIGEPLYLDIVSSFMERLSQFSTLPKIIGGRYGLSSKEFTPAMVKGIYDEMKKDKPKNHFTIGINDDVSFTSLSYDPKFNTEDSDTFRGIFWGLGADGTVSANKNSIKIIGEETENFAQGFFVYDSKKSGSKTTSHLRFGKNKIRSTYLITSANFIAVHQFQFLEKYDVLKESMDGATLLLNAPYSKDEVWNKIPGHIQKIIIDKKIKLYSIDALTVARSEGMGGRINTIMQTCFFAISGILPREEAIEKIKYSIKKTFIKKGMDVVEKNYKAVDATLANLNEITYPKEVTNKTSFEFKIPDSAPEFVKNFTFKLIQDKGDDVPVSLLPTNGVFPTGTTKYEKRNIADQIPVWDPSTCIQCGKCSFVCPHSVIRIKAYDESELKNAPESFKASKAKGAEFDPNTLYTIQVAPEDCTGCELCVEVCPAKNKSEVGKKAINMTPVRDIQAKEISNYNFFDKIKSIDRLKIKRNTVKGSQLLEPLFEFSGACAGCGETPYIKLATQLFGDRMLIANATGCSSIYGGNLPTTPYTTNSEGRGPAWSNSLFEDNAEYGLGMRLAVEHKNHEALELLCSFTNVLGREFVESILNNQQTDEALIFEQRKKIVELKTKLKAINSPEALNFITLADYLVKKSVWIFGGDGWAYDIGFGGLDHVMASGKNVNILVMDTEVYSNTGGQMSKSTPMGAVAKFASNGRAMGKKDLALHAISYGHVYVAKIAFGANDTHTLKVLQEAEKFDGPSLIIAYSHCIAHGYNLKHGLTQQKLAVDSGHWHLFRFHPDEVNGFSLDSEAPKKNIKEFMGSEARFKMLNSIDPKRAEDLSSQAQVESLKKFDLYKYMSQMNKKTEVNTETKN